MKLNLGCGAQVLDGWCNVDYAIGARFVKIPFFKWFNGKAKLFNLTWDRKIILHDLTKKFPWADDSVEIVYSSHTLEHFSKEDGKRFLSECHRVLKKKGIIRIVVPDLQDIINGYNDGRIKADDFLEKLGVLYDNSKNPMKKGLYFFFQFPHKCMYDNQRLISVLNEIGFDASKRLPFDSVIEGIRGIELKERTEQAVIIEGYKR